MKQIPTLYTDYRECILDIDIFGKIISAPQQSIEELTETLFEEYKRRTPLPTLEYRRYELSRQVSSDYKIAYDRELTLQDNESLVDLQSMARSLEGVSFADLAPLVQEVQEHFSYEAGVTDDVRAELIKKYDLETGEEFKPGIRQTENIVGSTEEDSGTYLSDAEIENLGKVDDPDAEDEDAHVKWDSEPEPVENPVIEYDQGVEIHIGGSEDVDSGEDSDIVEEAEGDSSTDSQEDDDDLSAFADFADESSESEGGGDSADDELEAEGGGDGSSDGTSKAEGFGTEVDEEDDSGVDYGDQESEDEASDADYGDREEDDSGVDYGDQEEDDSGVDYGDQEEDDSGVDYGDQESEDDASDADYGDQNDEDDDSGVDFGDRSEEDDGGVDFGDREADGEDGYEDLDAAYGDSDEEGGVEDLDAAYGDDESDDGVDFSDRVEGEDTDDSGVDFSDRVEDEDSEDDSGVDFGDISVVPEPEFIEPPRTVTRPVQQAPPSPAPPPPRVVTTSQQTVDAPVDRSSEPTDIRAFCRKHPRCEIEFALKYFTKKQISDAIRIGKITKSGTKLRA